MASTTVFSQHDIPTGSVKFCFDSLGVGPLLGHGQGPGFRGLRGLGGLCFTTPPGSNVLRSSYLYVLITYRDLSKTSSDERSRSVC